MASLIFSNRDEFMKLFKTYLTALSICTYMTSAFAVDYSNPDEIKCISSVCRNMSRGQLDQLDRLIDNEILEGNISAGTQNIAIVLNAEKGSEFERALKANSKPSSFDMESTETYMAFRYSGDQRTYYSANAYMVKNALNKENYVTMNTVGFGRQLRDGWLVEIEVIKEFDKKKKITSDLRPNGLLLSIKRRW